MGDNDPAVTDIKDENDKQTRNAQGILIRRPKKKVNTSDQYVKTMLIASGIMGVILVIFVAGFLTYTYLIPESDVDLSVSVNRSGRLEGGEEIYVDTSAIEIYIRNSGKSKAEGDLIEIKVSGKNVVRETIEWDGIDISPDCGASEYISIEVIDMDKEFTLTVKAYYDGEYQDSDEM